MKSHRALFGITAALLGSLGAPASASTVLARSFEEMTRSVPLVVVGTVVGSRVVLENGRIFTFTDVRVEEAIKGKSLPWVTVRQPGGEVGKLGQRVEGAAELSPKERVLLFLEVPRDRGDVYVVSSMAAGKVRLQKRATRNLTGLALYGAQGATPLIAPRASEEDLGAANEFLSRIRKAAEAAR